MEFSINMNLQIGDELRTVHTAQLVYLNHEDLCSNSLHWMTSYWLDQEFTKRMETIKIFKLLQFLFFVMPIYN